MVAWSLGHVSKHGVNVASLCDCVCAWVNRTETVKRLGPSKKIVKRHVSRQHVSGELEYWVE